MVDWLSLFPLHLLNMVSAGCLRRSLGGGLVVSFSSSPFEHGQCRVFEVIRW